MEMGDSGYLRSIAGPVALTGFMLLIAAAASSLSGVHGFYLIGAYAGAGLAITFVSVLIWMFVKIGKMAIIGADHPIKRVSASLQDRWVLLILPGLILPAFLAAYTIAKTSIYFLVGFGWDRFWADVDSAMFGGDPWRLTHTIAGPIVSVVWAWVYTAGWGLALFFFSAFVSLYCEHRKVAVYFTSMIAAWMIGGVIMAYCTSAAGPIFAHLFDPALTGRFEPLRQSLSSLLPADSNVRMTQSYLAQSTGATLAVKGGGISAMPSMHLAACTIYVMAAIRTRWFVPTILFWVVIFFGSVHFGYHYAVDGLVAAVIAIPCWLSAEAFYRKRVTPPITPTVSQAASG
jgi:hypothetical protein